MLCSDLERYLEAYLDGRLGRSRTTILRRHLGMCGPCRSRVERLRRFERELGSQLGGGGDPRAGGAGGGQPSVWQGLETDLVRSFQVGGADIIPLLRPAPPGPSRLRPPAAPRGGSAAPAAGGRGAAGAGRRRAAAAAAALPPALRRRLSRVAGVLAVALAVGAVYEFARSWLVPEDPAGEASQAYQELADGGHDLALRTADPASLQNWFAAQLGGAFPPPPVPAGFRLVGGARAELARHDAAAIVYEPDGPEGARPPTVLFVRPAPGEAVGAAGTPPVPLERDGLHQLAWDAEPYSFRLVSAEPPARLREFAP